MGKALSRTLRAILESDGLKTPNGGPQVDPWRLATSIAFGIFAALVAIQMPAIGLAENSISNAQNPAVHEPETRKWKGVVVLDVDATMPDPKDTVELTRNLRGQLQSIGASEVLTRQEADEIQKHSNPG